MQIQGMGSLGSGQSVSSNALGKTNRALQKILEQLSTAKRINRASDDAAGLAIAEQLQTQTRGFKMASYNVEAAESALNIADGAASETSDMIQRQRELALQASNSTLSDQQRQALDTEFQQISQEIDRTSRSANYNRRGTNNGTDLASGSAQVQVGANSGQTVSLPQVNTSAASLGISGLSIATQATANSAVSDLDNAMSNLNTQRTGIGAMVNRLGSTLNNLSTSEINTQAAESAIRDEDMALGLAELTRAKLLQESGASSFARFNEISQNHLFQLMQGT